MKTTRPPRLLVSLLTLNAVTSAALAADQFAYVSNPGWTNTSQYSWAGAWGDYDGDGYIDLFVANTSTSFDPGRPFLYRNNGDGTFAQRFASEVGTIVGAGSGAVGGYWGDLNNDDHLDLFLPNYGSNNCFLNLGNGTFTAAEAGDLTKPSFPWGAGNLVDYDHDGWLDAFSVTAGSAEWFPAGRRTNLLYHALGNLSFEWVTQGPVVSDQVGSDQFSNSAVWGDFDNDGDPDLLVANWEGMGAFFYRNDGQGQFTRLTTSVLEQLQYAAGHHAWGDYDNDGDLDVVAAGWPIRLFQNNTPADFTPVTSWPLDSAVPSWVDYDNDGHLDLALAQGQGSPQRLWLLRNKGDGTFERVEDVFTRTLGRWISMAWGDYDNDGFADWFVAHELGQNQLFRNLGNANHWIKFQLEGTVANRSAIGAKIRVQATIGGQSVWQMREISGGNVAHHDPRPNFGLGDASTVDRVIIEWPSGIVQELSNLPANEFRTVTEPPRLRPLASNGFQIQCWLNQSFDIQASTDLAAWTYVTTLTNETGTLEFHDPQNSNDDCRYYRVLAR